MIALNKLGDAATAVRRQFITTLVARKTLPKGAATFIADCLARDSYLLSQHNGDDVAAELLGIDAAAIHRAVSDLPAGSDNRALVIALALVVGALEARSGKDAWRNPSPVREPGDDRIHHGRHVTNGDLLRFLVGQGYTLSAVEEVVTGNAVLMRSTTSTSAKQERNSSPGGAELRFCPTAARGSPHGRPGRRAAPVVLDDDGSACGAAELAIQFAFPAVDHNRRPAAQGPATAYGSQTFPKPLRCARWKTLRRTLAAYPALRRLLISVPEGKQNGRHRCRPLPFSRKVHCHGTRARHHQWRCQLRKLAQRRLASARPIGRSRDDRPRGTRRCAPGQLERPQDAAGHSPGAGDRRQTG